MSKLTCRLPRTTNRSCYWDRSSAQGKTAVIDWILPHHQPFPNILFSLPVFLVFLMSSELCLNRSRSQHGNEVKVDLSMFELFSFNYSSYLPFFCLSPRFALSNYYRSAFENGTWQCIFGKSNHRVHSFSSWCLYSPSAYLRQQTAVASQTEYPNTHLCVVILLVAFPTKSMLLRRLV
jgi:hypothetical protein